MTRVTYTDMFRFICAEHSRRDVTLSEFSRREEQLDAIDPTIKSAVMRERAICASICELIAWCADHAKLVKETMAKERGEKVKQKEPEEQMEDADAA
ncbi:MAG TPA: hypothetical protein VFX37_10640 [Pseudolabrys sp.]|nr:hypothetical protein [Pseudolabrys sp.]